jgi:hypothetical protein
MPCRFHNQLVESIAELRPTQRVVVSVCAVMIVTSESTRLQWSLPPFKSSICSITLSEHQSQRTIDQLALVWFRTPVQYDKYRGVALTSKSTLMISPNPSSNFGARYLEAKLVNASFGSIVLFSGLVCEAVSQQNQY